jgi:NAD(P)-dependent dehydrogenase (short-subunit alcohol dehydrogenase family)
MLLRNKRALVTGGASGIGQATVELFVREGACVGVCDLNADAGNAFADRMRSQGGCVSAVAGDVSNEQDVRRMVEQSIEFLGGLDILVNSAGTAILGNVTELSLEDWNRVIAVNLTGVFLMSKYAIPAMIAGGGGSIVNIASVAAFMVKANHPAYCASKGGVVALTHAIAADYASAHIRVNAVCPAGVETPLAIAEVEQHYPDRDWREVAREFAQAYPMKRIAQPCEIASTVLFLASEQSSYMTGAALVVDGGYMLGTHG